MVTKNEGYLTNGGSNVDSTTVSDGGTTDGESIGTWQEGKLWVSVSHGQGSASDVELEISSHRRDATNYVREKNVTIYQVGSSETKRKSVDLGGNSDDGNGGAYEYIKLKNVSGFQITLTAEYETHTY
jgi:hypothetical protein